MPERWERELRKLSALEVDEPTVRERVERGPSEHRRPSRRNPLVAGVVAGAVAIAGIAVLWQLDDRGREIGAETRAVAVPRVHALAGAWLLRLGRGRHPAVIARVG